MISPSQISLEEGGPAEIVEFQTYLPPPVMCMNLAFVNTPVGLVQALVAWITGNIGQCNVRVTMTTYNYVNNLLAERITISIPLIGDQVINLGRPV